MEVPVLNQNGQQVSTFDLPDNVFGVEVNTGLMHQAYVRQMANARQGTHKVKTRSEVNRTKAKWYRQKGTGRARHGSRNAPIFVGGGIAHGPHPRKYTKNMPRKMRRQALRCALSDLAGDDRLVIVDRLALDAPKAKIMNSILANLVGDGSALILMPGKDEAIERSVRNLPDAQTLNAMYLNIRDLLTFDKVIVPLDALEIIIAWLG
ncbi:MAG: 50S ribosomal protein L4 [Anaerolineae bacterium]|nr:50S ribosomal protein L4 [Anaerolineae bacterium]